MRTAMSNETKKTGSSFMEKLSTVIVDKRNLIFLLTIILLVFSAFSRNWVEVESDLTYYLPSDSETKQALDIMDEQFTTYGTAEVMVANITRAGRRARAQDQGDQGRAERGLRRDHRTL